jgi:hypothetical protein
VRDVVRASLACKQWRDVLQGGAGGAGGASRAWRQPFFHPSLQQALRPFRGLTAVDLSACSAVPEAWLACLQGAPIQVPTPQRPQHTAPAHNLAKA